ncbi:low-density lipoprotein receptor-related protein 11-like isoform X2 [Ptychodera flava]|uniref:low-density lipoprotein receptor-related protein 11-like isoform X2 n=1 Tax=Ptychodera flava TaxID=63121 RepID=UPI00396A4F80
MTYLAVSIVVLTCACIASSDVHGVVPKKGYPHTGNSVPDTGRSWVRPAFVEPQREESVKDQEKNVDCLDYFQAHTDSIVRTKDSLKAGATFLNAPSPISDIDECMGWCQCGADDEQLRCDMVVFESKNKNCYLFRCMFDGENKCLFAHHQGYTSMVLDENAFSKASEAEAHAQDLEGLADSEPTEAPQVTTTKASTTTLSTTTTEKKKVPCARYEFQCDNGDCIGIYHACDGIPHCLDMSDEQGCSYVKHEESVKPTLKQEDPDPPASQQDYFYNRNHNSNPRPGTQQELGQSNDYEDLKNYYQQHYGHNNNNDNSERYEHKDKPSLKGHSQDNVDNQRYDNWNGGDRDNGYYTNHNSKNHPNNRGSSEQRHQNTNKDNTYGHNPKNEHDYSNPWYYLNGDDRNHEDFENSEYPDIGDEDNDNDDDDDDAEEEGYDYVEDTESPAKHNYNGKAETAAHQEPTKAANVEVETVPAENAGEPTEQVAENTPEGKESDKATEAPPLKNSKNSTQTHEEEVGVEEINGNGSTGRTLPETSAILPLAIGLAITLLLLIMVACRLRMVKRKLRYGRPLQKSQEADYLINGMYL